MKINLVVMTEGKSAGKSIPIPSAQFIIGRDPQCNLRPGSVMISKRHCAILMKNDQAFLRDFDSTNGTFLNDESVKGEVPLRNGDILKVGPLVFKVAIELVPTVSKPTLLPLPKKFDADDDAGALLLDTDNVIVNTASALSDTKNEIPGSATLMESPVLPGGTPEEAAPPADTQATESKPHTPKPAEPKKENKTGAAQEAAQAILDKLRSGKRKQSPIVR